MTHDPDQRLLFSPGIMPFLCLYPESCLSRGVIISSGFLVLMSWYISIQQSTSKKKNEKLTPLTDWVCTLPFLSFCFHYILYPPYTMSTCRCTP